MQSNATFVKTDPSTISNWWYQNQANKGVIARWRRIREPEAAYMEPSFANFVSELGGEQFKSESLEKIAYTLALISHVQQNDATHSFGQQLAKEYTQSESGHLRFRKLYECGDKDFRFLFRECLRGIRRLDGVCNIRSIGELVLQWPYSRKRLAQDFFKNYVSKNKGD